VGFVNTYVLTVDTTLEDTAIEEQLKRFWELESLGVKPMEESIHSKFVQEINYKNGRYEVNLPWRGGHLNLPENYEICVRRLHGLHRRLIQDPDLLRAYDDVIREQLKSGIVERVHEKGDVPTQVHYLPHHPVVKKDKTTTKVRVVYDASCAETGLSLNQCLHVGPSFGQSILDILVQFRMHKVALVGDIEKAFLMVGVSERDRDVLRFLWFEDPFLSPPRIIKYRFTRVVFGVSASPFLLNATIRHHVMKYEETDPEFVSRFLHGIYVDDLTSGGEDEDDCYHFYVKSKMRLLEAGFNLRKFASNSSILRDKIAENEDSKVVSSMSQRVLGVLWNPTEDQLVFDITPVIDILAKLNPTKRNVVGASARIHDPLGVLSPITVRFKIFFQQLCSVKLGWDEQVIGELRYQWQALISSLKGLQQVMIPRHPPQIDASHSLQLVGFCDASQRAYAAVVYLKTNTSTGTTLSILAAKTRVAPLKTVTIPRLELLSALLLARLVKTVSDSLLTQLEPPTCFTDSLIALCWIRHVEKEWKQFVENRVSEIRTLVPPLASLPRE
jgi:hypothetical protein